MKDTDTREGSMGAESSWSDPREARIRPQLRMTVKNLFRTCKIETHFASSPYSAVFTSAEVEIREAIVCASSYVFVPFKSWLRMKIKDCAGQQRTFTVTVTNLVAPSPSRTTSWASSFATSVRASRN